MEDNEDVALIEDLMVGFARRTGLVVEIADPRRYLWTDAFAVCNFLELYRRTREERYLDLGSTWSTRCTRCWAATGGTMPAGDGSAVYH